MSSGKLNIWLIDLYLSSCHNHNIKCGHLHGRQLRPLPASLSLKWQSMVAFPPHFIAASIFFWGPVYCLCLDIKILYICTCTICTHRRTKKFSKSVQSADGRWRSQWDLEMEKINRIYVYYLGLGRKSFFAVIIHHHKQVITTFQMLWKQVRSERQFSTYSIIVT